MRKQLMHWCDLIPLTLLIMLLSTACGDEKPPAVTIFAAASTTNAITEIGILFAKEKGVQVIPSFASSSTLAKQIEQGAPADIYISANPQWMDYLQEKNRLESGTRVDLLGNQIVLVAPSQSAIKVEITHGFDLDGLLGGKKLSMGDPDHVPAGIYGKQALEKLGVWEKVSLSVARSMDVRAALALVERKEAPLGVVYATDAAISKKVRIVGTFPESSHPKITYPAAIISGKSNPTVAALLEFLRSEKAKAIFQKNGFIVN